MSRSNSRGTTLAVTGEAFLSEIAKNLNDSGSSRSLNRTHPELILGGKDRHLIMHARTPTTLTKVKRTQAPRSDKNQAIAD